MRHDSLPPPPAVFSPTTMLFELIVGVRDVSVEQLSQALEGKCRVLKLDSDEEEDMSGALNVSLPDGHALLPYALRL